MPRHTNIPAMHAFADTVAHKLSQELGITCYVYKKAATGSCYLKFEKEFMRSVRIGDHDGREKYSYMWNIRYDRVPEGWVRDKKSSYYRYYVRKSNWTKIIHAMKHRIKKHSEVLPTVDPPTEEKESYNVDDLFK